MVKYEWSLCCKVYEVMMLCRDYVAEGIILSVNEHIL